MLIALLVLALLLLGVVAVLLYRERRAARAVGMSQEQPACGKCLYLLGGWSSSNCPECGSDVRRVGVRTGPQNVRVVADFGVILAALIVVGPLVGMGMNFVFAQNSVRGHGRWTLELIPGVSVRMDTKSRWRRFPPACTYKTTLDFTRLLNSQGGGAWVNGRYVGPSPTITKALIFDQETGFPNREELDEAINFVVGEAAEEGKIRQQVVAIEAMLEMIHQTHCSGQFQISMLMKYSSSELKQVGSGGSFFSLMHWLGFVCTGISMIVFGIAGFMAVGRWCRQGWRLPQRGEWERKRFVGE